MKVKKGYYLVGYEYKGTFGNYHHGVMEDSDDPHFWVWQFQKDIAEVKHLRQEDITILAISKIA